MASLDIFSFDGSSGSYQSHGSYTLKNGVYGTLGMEGP